ncbi:MAG TPA: insulinase family protein, partial [Candidatus Polarisedimenticolia bacterium]|nr:insulinase family protein [Candidatus Polarisedimenticolia bacterium]
MLRHRSVRRGGTAAIAAALALAAGAPAAARAKVEQLPPSSLVTLDNGLQAVLIPSRAVPLITSVAVVGTGSADETPLNNGVSHMLEHLLFSGTSRRAHADIAAAQGRLGVVHNAHTGAEHTALFVLAPRESFAQALDLQADMLFGSTLPAERVEVERGIVANEIARDAAQDETAMAALYAAGMYRGGLSLPVIGTETSVRALSRDAIERHHRTWYVANNVTLIVMGDFDPVAMESLVRRCFSAAAPGLLPDRGGRAGAVEQAALGRVHSAVTAGPARRLWLGAPAPGMSEQAFHAARMLASLAGPGLLEAANARLAAAGAPGAFVQAAAGLDTRAGAATFQVRAVLDDRLGWEEAGRALLEETVARMGGRSWKGRDLDRVRLADKSAMLRLWEKPHYFGLDRAPYVASAGWSFARDLSRSLGWVEPADVEDAGRRVARPESWAIFRAGPDAPPGPPAPAAAAPHAGGEDQPARFTQQSEALVRRWRKAPAAPAEGPLPDPSPPAASRGAGTSISARTILANRMMLLLACDDASRVFAVHVLVKDRALIEPPGKGGIAELLHAVMAAGPRERRGDALEEALRAVGGTLKTADDPELPYDDISLSPEYSYLRLEALDEHAAEALDLLQEILESPALDDDTALRAAREQLVARVRRGTASPRDTARRLLAAALWGKDHPFARPIAGTEESLASITLEDLKAFHARAFAPGNLIVAVETSLDPAVVLPLIESRLGRMKAAPAGRRPDVPAA